MADTYEGWTNRETWATSLHLNNDQGLYEQARSIVASGGPWALRDFVEETLDLWDCLVEYGTIPRWVLIMAADIGSLWRVNWPEVAEGLTDE